jgi:DNA-binding MarR family transcriptional regulator
MSEFNKEFPANTLTLVHIIAKHYKENDGPITTSELAEEMHVSAAAISQILAALEKHHLVKRKKTDADRRFTYVVLTMKGRIMMKRFNHPRHSHVEAVSEYLDFLGEEDTKHLMHLLERTEEFMELKDRKDDERK